MAAKDTQQYKLISAAIDFGTTFSSWAFSFRHTFEKDPTDVSSRTWNDGSHISSKAPTTVLIRPDGHTLEAFGYDAENRYVNLVEDEEHEDFYLFKHFKMQLFQQMMICIKINRSGYTKHERVTKYHVQTLISDDLMIEDETGKSLDALTVFSLAIGDLKDDLLATVNKQMAGGVTVDDITWVLTVPAIWTDSAKWFMRRASELAGISPENLRISLEPEAASIFCRHMNVGKRAKGADSKVDIAQLAPGTKYLVLDAGGGTVDITVHQVEEGGKILEIHQASGGPWGGTNVNEAYQDLLRDIVGEDVFRTFKKEHLEYFLDLERDFEIAKRKVDPDKDSKVRMKFPSILKELFKTSTGQDIMEHVNKPELVNKISLKIDKQVLDTETSRKLFRNTLTNITKHLPKVFDKQSVKGTDIILMVGGFSESNMLQHAIRKAFPGKAIIVPTEAGLAVLKGAVIVGHSDMEITSRISKYSYGLSARHDFDPKIHPEKRAFMQKDGQIKVRNVFSALVHAGGKVFPYKPCTPKCFNPVFDESGFSIKLYASPDKNPQYVDDPGCVPIGEAYVDCIDSHGRVGHADVSIMLGGSEIEVMAVNNLTGKETRCVFKSV